MNRAERRRSEKLKLKPAVRGATNLLDYIHIYTLSMALALDSCGVPKEQALEIIQKVEENANCMAEGYISLDDVEQMCIEQYGVNFVKDKQNVRLFVKEDGTIMEV